MHIVWVHRGMYPDHIGGTYSYIYELGRRLAARGHKVDVIARALSPENSGYSEFEGIGVHRYTYRRVNPVYSTLQHVNKCYSLFAQIHAKDPVDIVGIHDAHLGLKIARSSLGRSVCQVPTYHAPVFLEFRFNTTWKIRAEKSPLKRAVLRLSEPPLEYWQRWFEAGVLRPAQGILVLSQFTRRNIETYFPRVDIGRVKIIPSGVDTDRFAPADDKVGLRRKLGMDGDATYILTVRKLVPRMGLENLLKAVALVRERRASEVGDLRVVVCGSGPLMPVLKSLAGRLGIADAVKLAGHVQDEILVNYYQAADLFVLPTEALEGFGISTVEALSANLPVVGTPAGATPEILGLIDPRLLTRDMSPEAIADAVGAWLQWRGEEKGTTRYRDEVLSRYSWDGVTDAIEAYYAEVLEAFRRERHGR